MPRNEVIVHVHRYRDAFTVLLAKRIAKRPDVRVISTRHTVRPGRNSALFRRIYDKLQAHIFVSTTAFKRFRTPWPDALPMQEKRVHILHNSLYTGEMHDAPQPLPEKGPIVALYMGPLVEGKGIETIIDALALIGKRRLRVRIAGEGNPDYVDTLRRRAMTRGVMDLIDWKIAPLATDDIHLAAQSHFLVLPSTEREAFGLSNLQAMAAGRAQICSPNGAQAEYLVDGESAIFVPPADATAFADAMRRLAEDAELRAKIGAAAFAAYRRHLAWTPFIRALTKIYSKL